MELLREMSREEYRLNNLCFKGGGGGGGGTGKVEYPTYMQTIHNDWLDNTGADSISSSITDVMNAALTTNPFAGLVAYTGSTEIAAIKSAATNLELLVDALDSDILFSTYITNVKSTIEASVFDETSLNAAVAAFTTILDNDLLSTVLPRFEAGMRDINAVNSTAFAVGKALIEANRDDQLAKYDADFRHKMHVLKAESIMQNAGKLIESDFKIINFQNEVTRFLIESNRMSLIAGREGVSHSIDVITADATWDFEVFQWGGNLLAAIGGGVTQPGANKMSKTQSVLSGLFGGASMGTQIGGTGWGTAIGGILGGVGGLLG